VGCQGEGMEGKSMRESFVFYKSYWKAIRNLSKTEQAECMKVVFDYVFEDIEISEQPGIEYTVFSFIKPQIDANNIRYTNGKKGGRPSKEKKPSDNQEETMSQPNANVNANVNVPKTLRSKHKNIKTYVCLDKYPLVKISEIELSQIKEKFPTTWEAKLEKLYLYIGSKGDKYKSHYLTILNWAKKDVPEKTEGDGVERIKF
jgi:hypothetical protein